MWREGGRDGWWRAARARARNGSAGASGSARAGEMGGRAGEPITNGFKDRRRERARQGVAAAAVAVERMITAREALEAVLKKDDDPRGTIGHGPPRKRERAEKKRHAGQDDNDMPDDGGPTCDSTDDDGDDQVSRGDGWISICIVDMVVVVDRVFGMPVKWDF
jgi:hypothetical protein